ncbi:MAG: hypothetical protein Q7S47_00545 [bacterium]|nr:hypothetical protein [bacterium]
MDDIDKTRLDEALEGFHGVMKDQVDQIASGCVGLPPNTKPVGSFNEDDPETHRRMRAVKPQD